MVFYSADSQFVIISFGVETLEAEGRRFVDPPLTSFAVSVV